MKLNFKRVFRGWLPEQPGNVQKLRQHSTPIVVGLAVTFLTVSLFFVSSNFFVGSGLKTLPVAPVVNNTVNDQEVAPTPEPTAKPLNLTKEEALTIGERIIKWYAAENNRVISHINVELAKAKDYGIKGNDLPEFLEPNCTSSVVHDKSSYYPVWVISACFQDLNREVVTYDENGTVIDRHLLSGEVWVTGYNVAVWADIGEIMCCGPMCAV